MYIRSTIFSLFALVPFVLGDVIPTSPDGSTVVKVGEDIKALWDVDTSGQWNDLTIQLMTGDNLAMVPLATLATGIDGTTTSSLDIPCPDVTPYSKIYFLQFTLPGNASSATWTTRFTIAGADGSTVEPAESTVYSGTTVQWGTGALVGSAPQTIVGAATNTSSNATTPSSTSSVGVGFISVTSVAPLSTSDSTSSSSSSATSTSTSVSGSASRASAAPASSSGAAIPKRTVGLASIVLALAGLVAL